jgi:hypothetical protein
VIAVYFTRISLRAFGSREALEAEGMCGFLQIGHVVSLRQRLSERLSNAISVFVQLAVSLEVIRHCLIECVNNSRRPLFEVRDKEVKGDELEELVRVFVERVKYQVLELKKRHGLNWSPENFCAGSVFTGGTSGGEICKDFQKRRCLLGAYCGFSHDVE